ncbi:MAG: TetR/AcrR family transcriptional regulator [Gemmatimonadetes bacterium]|nr:TetR/AcrR family transcriptional regulator [Gemmatimonadota bacterium]MBT8479521.1 TetR/AcrR family transcriptional regulator [Gemmatimonadota bacterium]NNK47873.1 TetR/AcrR family transcriptional regulator [Gemmatimonadota bacterium]
MTNSHVTEKAGSRETETAILEAARNLLAEGGLDALSMRAVAAQVGLSATAIYHWFEGKEDLVDRVVAHGFQRSEAYMRKSIEHIPAGSMERVSALGEAYIRFALENREYFKIIFAIQTPAPRHMEDVPGQGGYRVLRECVVEAMEAGNMRKTEPDIVVLYLWSLVHGLVTIFMACDPQDLLAETGCCEGLDERELTIGLFERFRDVVRIGLQPVEVTKGGPR